jgi:uncharacterized protein YcbX
MELSALYRHPVKSLKGESLQELVIGPHGPEFDRHWMVVNERGRFLTQRELPRMVLVTPRVTAAGLALTAPGMPPLEVAPKGEEVLEVQVWNDRCRARAMNPEADRWLSEFLGLPCRLVYLPGEEERQVDLEYARPGDRTEFSDGFPELLISRASLDDLNRRMGRSLPMERFRPNLVVSGCEPYAEDGWKRIRIGDLGFRVVKPCSRCVIPTVNPETGEREGNEPLKTLMRYRKEGNKVFFGQNLIHDGEGVLRVGMPVEVLE